MEQNVNQKAYFETLRDRKDELTVFSRDFSTCLSHFHSQLEILFVAEGSAQVTVNDSSALLKAGGISFSDSYDIHKYTDSAGENRFITLIIPRKYCTHFHNYLSGRQISYPFISDSALCSECIDLAKKLSDAFSDEYLKRAYIDLILAKLCGKMKFEEHHRRTNMDLMRSILIYIDDNLCSELSLETVADRFGYSPSHFSRIFRSAFNCRLGDYVKQLRLKALEEKVRQEGCTNLSSLIYECGFSSSQTFYRVFYKNYNTTPQKYFADLKKPEL